MCPIVLIRRYPCLPSSPVKPPPHLCLPARGSIQPSFILLSSSPLLLASWQVLETVMVLHHHWLGKQSSLYFSLPLILTHSLCLSLSLSLSHTHTNIHIHTDLMTANILAVFPFTWVSPYRPTRPLHYSSAYDSLCTICRISCIRAMLLHNDRTCISALTLL